MTYFLDFDRTVFDTEAFKRAVRKRPPLLELLRQGEQAFAELLAAGRGRERRRSFQRTLGTFLSHGRFAFAPDELRGFLYPDAVGFLASHPATIVTYGVRAFITAKVATALVDFPELRIVYTSRRKGRTLRRLTEHEPEACVFIDDMAFQLASVSSWCPRIECIEMRRDGRAGDGRWRVIRSFQELQS